jgi:hypothetical protein
MIYDINLQQAVPSGSNQLLTALKRNPFNNVLVAQTTDNLLILDNDFKILTEASFTERSQPRGGFPNLEFVDEYTLMSTYYDTTVVTDLRTFKPLFSIPGWMTYNGAGRGLKTDVVAIGTIWNLKKLTRESVVPLPNEVMWDGNIVCNSNLAVFSSTRSKKPSCLSFSVM